MTEKELPELLEMAKALGRSMAARHQEIVEDVLVDMPEGPEKDAWRYKLSPRLSFCDHGMGVCECGFLKRCVDCKKDIDSGRGG